MVRLYMCILYLVYMYLFLKGGLSLNYELFFVLMGIPGSLPFFVKLLSLCYVVGGGSLLVFVFLAFFFINGVLCYHLIVGSYTLGFSGKLFQVYFVSLFLGIVWFF